MSAAALTAVFLLNLSACAVFQRRVKSGSSADSLHKDYVGPPEPVAVFGPDPVATRDVFVVIGPGMATALSGVGVIRALSQEGVRIVGVAGFEFGAFIAAAYASSGSANQMEWPLLQFKKEWVSPRTGLSRFLTASKRKSDDLLQGLEKVFPRKELSSLKAPAWVFFLDRTNSWRVLSDGAVSSALCAALVHLQWMEPCNSEVSATLGAGLIRDQWERSGLRAPVIWILPESARQVPGGGAEEASGVRDLLMRQRAQFLRLVEQSRSADDLEITPPAVTSDYFDFERRSELIYSGKQEAQKRLGEWMSRLGWSQERRGR